MTLKVSLKMKARIKASKKFKIKRTEIFKKCFSAFLENKNAEKKILKKKIILKKKNAFKKNITFVEKKMLEKKILEKKILEKKGADFKKKMFDDALNFPKGTAIMCPDNPDAFKLTQALIKAEGYQDFMSELKPPTRSGARKMRDPLNINGGIIKLAQKKWTDNDVEVEDFLNWLPSIVNDTGFFISEASPRVAMFHLGMKAKGGVINLKKGLFSKNKGEGRPFIMRGRLIGCGNKCAAVLLDDPDDYEPDVMTSRHFKCMKNAYYTGKGQIKKVVYEESVIMLDDDEGCVEEKINKEAEERGWVIHST